MTEAPTVEREAFSVAEISQQLGLCQNGVYELIRGGEIKAVRLGRRLIVPRAERDRLLGKAS